MMREIKRRVFIFISVIALSIGMIPFTPIEAKASTDAGSSFWIEYIDVGQGDSAIVQCDGHYMIIDGGPSSASSLIYTVLKNAGIQKLDYMIATHPDEDHIGGLSGALNYASVGICYSPVTSHDTKTFNSLLKYLGKQNVSITVPTSGTSFSLGSANVELVGPIESSADSNNMSIVTRVTYGSTSFLFMGDAEVEEENSIIGAKKNIDCDVLKVGHHGSRHSTSDSLLNLASPQYAIISVGSDNSYSHPTEETLTKLKSYGVSLYRTDMQGDITCTSDGKTITFSTEKKASDDVLWIAGASSQSTSVKNGTVVAAPEKAAIPSGTTFVLNTNTKKFHLTTCSSVNEMSDKNRAFSTDSAESLVASGYSPCGRCHPYSGNVSVPDGTTQQVTPATNATADIVAQPSGSSYVLNTNTKKFHNPNCSSVSDMSAKNRKDVTATREEIISQGYVPCKRCNP